MSSFWQRLGGQLTGVHVLLCGHNQRTGAAVNADARAERCDKTVPDIRHGFSQAVLEFDGVVLTERVADADPEVRLAF